jgi:hypothetical protein
MRVRGGIGLFVLPKEKVNIISGRYFCMISKLIYLGAAMQTRTFRLLHDYTTAPVLLLLKKLHTSHSSPLNYLIIF